MSRKVIIIDLQEGQAPQVVTMEVAPGTSTQDLGTMVSLALDGQQPETQADE